jgi:hypothetical protein
MITLSLFSPFTRKKMPQAIATITLLTPYCQSRFHETPKKNKELMSDYERRTWRDRLHTDDENNVVIPPFAFGNCVKDAAKFLSIQIPGKGKATWTKHFSSGISVLEEVQTGISKERAIEQQMFVPSDGVKGSGKRVMKSYPLLMPPLTVQPLFYIVDELITPEVFAEHLQQAGKLIGIGAFRVQNGGIFGQFRVDNIDWVAGTGKVELPPINIVEFSHSKKAA